MDQRHPYPTINFERSAGVLALASTLLVTWLLLLSVFASEGAGSQNRAGVIRSPGAGIESSSPAWSAPAASLPDVSGATIGSVTVGGNPAGVAYDPCNRLVYVANSGSDSVTAINGTTNSVAAIISVGHQPQNIIVDTRTCDLYVANYGTDNVSVIDGSTNHIVATVQTGSHPWSLAYDAANDSIYVGHGGSTTDYGLSVISGSTKKVSAVIPIGSSQDSIAYDSADGTLYVGGNASTNLTLINTTTNKVVGGINGPQTYSMFIDGSKSRLYMAVLGGGKPLDRVAVLDTVTKSGLGSVPVGSVPTGFAEDDSSGLVFVTNHASGNVSVINASANQCVGSITVGSGPSGVAVDTSNGYIYVADGENGSVSIVALGVTTFPVTFSERGLAAGTSWSVTAGGSTDTSTGSFLRFFEPNGTLSYYLGPVSGYVASPASGTFTVTGGAVNLTVNFSVGPALYVVNFGEVGLPWGTSWSVTLNGTVRTSTSNGVGFMEANGTYSYVVGSVSGFGSSPSNGSLSVNGGGLNVSITFNVAEQVATYSVMFQQTGLPVGTNWSVTLNGSIQRTTAANISFSEPNGSYAFSADCGIEYDTSPANGRANVSGTPVRIQIACQNRSRLIPLTFQANGMRSGTNWTITLFGDVSGLTIQLSPSVTRSSDGSSSIEFRVSAGQYGYSATALGYKLLGGTVNVTGIAARSVSLYFVAIPSGPSSGGGPLASLPTGALGVGLAFILIGVAGLTGTVYRRRVRTGREGKALVAQMKGVEWEADSNGEPAPSSHA
jgi:YVTN family beta-propeller protein